MTFGIFIVIQLNNWNEEEKTNRVVDRIFTEIQNDLKKNRTNLTHSIKWYDKRDSLITLVKDRKLTFQDYSTNEDLLTLMNFKGL